MEINNNPNLSSYIKRINDLKIYIIVFLCSFGVIYFSNSNFDIFSSLLKSQTSSNYVLSYKDHIHEVNFIYLGSSRCVYSNDEKLYAAIRHLKSDLQNRVKKNDLGFSAIGIAAEWDPAKGIAHLEKFGKFDEINAGNAWSNHGVIKYVGEMGEEASTPQVFLILRTYSESISNIVVTEKRIISLTGKDEILRWYNEGAPLPQAFKQEYF